MKSICIFVSGGTGLLGSHLLFKLCSSGYSIIASYRSLSRIEGVRKIFGYYTSNVEALFAKIKWVELDLQDKDAVFRATLNCTIIYHCAAIVSFHPKKKEQTIFMNKKITSNIVEAALKNNIETFCHVSSIATLGRTTKNSYINEETKFDETQKNSPYSIGKYFAEQIVLDARPKGLNVVIVNPAVIIGPGWWNEGSGLFYSVMAKGLNFYTFGKTGFVDVRDVAEVMIQLVEDSSFPKKIILCSENLYYKDFFSLIAKSINVKPPRFGIPKIITGILWPFSELISFFTGNDPILSRFTARTSQQKYLFSGEKITQETGFKYRKIKDSISEFGKLYKGDF